MRFTLASVWPRALAPLFSMADPAYGFTMGGISTALEKQARGLGTKLLHLPSIGRQTSK
jgi:hypothetical protein